MNKKLNGLFFPGMTLYSVIMILFCVITAITVSPYLAAGEFALTAALFLFYRIRIQKQKREFSQVLQTVALSGEETFGETMNIPVPAAIVNLQDNQLLWCNEALRVISGADGSLFESSLEELFPGMNLDWIVEGKRECPEEVTRDGCRYQVYGDLIRPHDEILSYLCAMLYWVDMTELLDVRDEYRLSRPVVGVVLVDNYDELTANLADNSVSALSARLDDAITAWAAPTQGILRKLERNRYLLVFEERDLGGLIDEKFSILDTIREITNDNGTPATLSIGLGKEGTSFEENYDFACLSVEMSLSRGGDQAVIKDRYNFAFYGGKAKEAERRTKVKSRVMAGSLQKLIEQADKVLVMGHKNADIDAVGAAAGVMAICRKLSCPAKIVLDMARNSSDSLLRKLSEEEFYQDAFLSPSEALQEGDENTLLVVVDTNRPDQLESRELLEICPNVVVIDHHRRAADYIEDTRLNFHEPYASSACELVTEIIQYLMEREDLLPCETVALLAGIVLDTKNFSVRTGSRTFEAAAWLRKNGADTVAVKLLFQNDLRSTLGRYEILRHAELYREEIALCCLESTADRIIAAQAADELLNISGIQTSFVFYPDGDQVICSARSIGEANVQMILEPLGGGGNQATAGAQISGMTPAQVKEAIKLSINEFFSDEPI